MRIKGSTEEMTTDMNLQDSDTGKNKELKDIESDKNYIEGAENTAAITDAENNLNESGVLSSHVKATIETEEHLIGVSRGVESIVLVPAYLSGLPNEALFILVENPNGDK